MKGQVSLKPEKVNTRIEKKQTTLIKSMVLVMGDLLTILKVIDLFIEQLFSGASVSNQTRPFLGFFSFNQSFEIGASLKTRIIKESPISLA